MSAVDQANAILDDTWAILAPSSPFTRESGGFDQLPDVSLEAVARRSRAGREIQRRIADLDTAALPDDLSITVAAAAALAARWAREEDWYWLAFDPLGVGFFGMFAPSAYCGGFVINAVHEGIDQCAIASDDDAARFLRLVDDYGRLVNQLAERTLGQAERGIYLPAPKLPSAIAIVTGLKPAATAVLRAVLGRAEHDIDPAIRRAIDIAITTTVEPAYDALLASISTPDYASNAPEGIGIGQYPGGAELYADLVKLHTTLDLTPREVHERGHVRMARIQAEMEELIGAEGFAGTPREYLASLSDQPAWRADSAAGVAEHFERYIDRLAPELDRYFGLRPAAPYGVAALPEEVSGSMTFGYYSVPQPDREVGLYLFNAVNLTKTALPMVAALNYHELVPGHHFHMAMQRELEGLHALRRHSFVNAFNEGWAEYAARFAGEIGMYEEPEERFGRLIMEAFLTSRLVVDTGMNALGWTLEQAREYMRDYSFMSSTEVDSETLRYSCDLPGQALAYKLGDDFLYDLREQLRADLGEDFTVIAFHDAVMRSGGLPLPLVARAVRAELLGEAQVRS